MRRDPRRAFPRAARSAQQVAAAPRPHGRTAAPRPALPPLPQRRSSEARARRRVGQKIYPNCSFRLCLISTLCSASLGCALFAEVPQTAPSARTGKRPAGLPGAAVRPPPWLTFSASGKARWQLVPVGLTGEPNFQLAQICIIHYVLEEDGLPLIADTF